jgi:hypothetical protein
LAKRYILPRFCHRSVRFRRKIARPDGEFAGLRVIRPLPLPQGFPVMKRSPGAAGGFASRSAPVASSCLIQAVAASLAVGSLSLCLVVTLNILSTGASMALPL